VIETMDKVPGLGDIPILGKLFRSRSTQKSNDELLVVITPHLVRPLSAEEKAKLPDMPATFLPAVADQKGKPSKSKGPPPATPANQPEFVGPRGQQIPQQ
jgi:pilus assembly protein CpaC